MFVDMLSRLPIEASPKRDSLGSEGLSPLRLGGDSAESSTQRFVDDLLWASTARHSRSIERFRHVVLIQSYMTCRAAR